MLLKSKMRKIFTVAAVANVLLFTGCELGLGSAVDTLPPELSIEEPKANNIIYDTFVMSGTWDDELKKIQGITIQFENSTTQYEPITVPEENLADFKWFCEIDPVHGDQKFPDGKYNAIVTATDTDGKKTVKSVAFTLDNTPPMVILARPATKMDSLSPDGYGCEFELEGEAVDDNTISLVEVKVFDKETNNLKTTVSLENVAKKLERTVAVYGKEDGEYEKIYGVVEDLESILDSKNFYCEVIAYDEARKVPAVEGDKGNCAKFFFLESEVGTFVKDFKSSGFYEIFKGLYNPANIFPMPRDVGPKSLEDAQNALNNNRISQASFSLDPRNNPRYTVSSRSNLKELKNDFSSEAAKLINNTKVTVNVLRGLDEYNLVKDSIGIYLIECDASGNEVDGAEEIELFAPYKEGDDHEAREKLIKTTGSTYSIDVTVGRKTQPELVVGKTYLFVVKGHDEKNNKIINYANTDYAFKLASANVVPSLSITELGKKKGADYIKTPSTANISLANGEKLVIKGESLLEDLVPDVKFVVGLGTDLSNNTIGQISAKDFGKGFEWTIPDEYQDNAEQTSNFVIRIISINPEEPEQTNSKEIEVSVDTVKPAFTNISISPDPVEKDDKLQVNGTITIKGASEDAGTVSKVEYSIVHNGTESDRIVVEKFSSEGFKIKTTDYEDETDLVINLYATDKAGNEGKDTLSLFINQSTDLPVIEWSTVDPSIKTVADIKAASAAQRTANIFQINGINNYIGGTVSDDDGIKNITIFKKDSSGRTYEEKVVENGKSKTYMFKNVVSRIQGEYDIYVVVEDIAGEQTGFNVLTTEEFKAAVDEGAPNFVITTTQGLQAQDTELNIGGTVQDGTEVIISRYVYRVASEFDSAKRYFEKSGASYTEIDSSDWTELPSDKEYFERIKDPYTDEAYNFVDINIPVNETTWSDKVPAGEVGTEGDVLYYEATDRYGQTTGQVYIYSIDNQPPLFTISYVNSDYSISGKVEPESRRNIFVRAEAGKYLTIKGTARDVEENDPTKSRGMDEFAYYKLVESSQALDESHLVNGAFDISDWNPTKKIDSGNWQQTIDLGEASLSNGKSYILYIAVRDAAGNISKISENPCSAFYIIPDSTKPVIASASYKISGTVIGESEAIQINTSNNTDTAEGVYNIVMTVQVQDVVKDADGNTEAYVPGISGIPSGIASVELLEDNVSYSKTKSITSSGNIYTIKIKASDLANGTHRLVVRATDNVGNYSDFALKEIGVDVTPPSVPTITGVTPFVIGSDGKTYYNGKITISGIATDETDLSEITWYIKDEEGNKVPGVGETKLVSGTTAPLSIELDSDIELTQESGAYKLFISSKDKGGNECLTKAEKEILIRQKDDQPEITVLNAKTTITTLSEMQSAVQDGGINNIFGTSTNNELEFTVTDDDGIDEIKVSYKLHEAANYTEDEVYKWRSGDYENLRKINWTLPSVKELYDIKIDVQDVKGETTNYKANTTGVFVVAVDDEKPVISARTTNIEDKLKNDGIYYTNNDFQVSFNVQDDYKLESLSYQENEEPEKFITVDKNGTLQSKVVTLNKKGATGTNTKVKNIFTLKDIFGRYAKEEITYVYDLTAPVISDVNYTLINTNYIDALKTFTVTGKATDAGINQSGVSNVECTLEPGWVDTVPQNKVWESTSGSPSAWTAKIDAGSITAEGKYTFFIKATDLAGNESVLEKIQFIADVKAPEWTMDSVHQYYGEDVVISGTHTDSYFDKMEVKILKENTELPSANYKVTAPVSGSGKPWKVTIPVDKAGHTKDGSYEINIKFYDKSGKTVSVSKVTTEIDTEKPVVESIITPALVGGSGTIVSTEDYKFTGTASDNIGLGGIKYLINSSATATTEDAGWQEANGTATWNFYEKFVKGKTGTNCEGQYYLHIYASDNAGNKSDVLSRIFQVDFDKPEVVINNLPSSTKDKWTLSGTATDSRGLKAAKVSVTQKDPNGKETALEFAVDQDGVWTSAVKGLPVIPEGETSLAEGLYSYSVQAEDEVGKITTVPSSQIRYDISAPVVKITSHNFDLNNESSWLTDKSVTLTGSASDATGIASLKFKLDAGAYADLDGLSSWTKSLSNLSEGPHTISFLAEDENGNSSEYSYTLNIDSEAPSLGGTSIALGGKSPETVEDKGSVFANYSDTLVSTAHQFTLKGSATDSYKLGSIVVKAVKGNVTRTLVEKTSGASGETDTAWAWTCSVPLDSTTENYFENGEWNWTVTVRDAAGTHTDVQTFKVIVDTVLPVMNPVYELPSSADWRNKSTLKVKPAAADVNGSGLESVSYVLVKTEKSTEELLGQGAAPVSEGEWETITGANKNIETEKTISFENGANYLYLRAVDKAGNKSFTTVYRAMVDTEKPSVVMNKPGAVALVNGQVDIDVSKFEMKVEDQTALSGVSGVDIYIDSIDAEGRNIIASSAAAGGLSISADGNVTGSISKEKFAAKTSSFKIIAQVTDNAGNKSNVNTSIGVDVKSPDVTIKTSAKNGIANKDLTIEGTTYDLNGVASVQLEFLSGAEWIDVTDETNGLGVTNLGDTSAWRFVIPTYDAENKSTIAALLAADADSETPDAQVKFRATAVDVAMNTKTTETVVVTINQDSDRPVVSFVNLSENGQILQTPTINGNITDDDNWGTECVFKIDSVSHNLAGWRTYSQTGQLNIDSNGTFSYTPEDSSDGKKQMFFYIKDSVGTEFITALENRNDRPKLKFKNASESDNDAVIEFTADTASPAIKEVKLGTKQMNVSQVAGGNNSIVQIGMVVLDTNGVDSAKAVISGTEYPLSKVETTTDEDETFPNLANTNKDSITIKAGSKKAVWTSENIDVSSWTSGQTTVTFEVTDNSGLKSQTTGYFTVDNLGPQVTVRIPADFSEEKTGNVEWSFDWTDYPNTNNAGFDKYAYLVLNDDYWTGSAIDESKIIAYMKENLISIPENGTTVNSLSLAGLPMVAQADENSKFKKITTVRTDVYNLPVYFYAVDKNGNENLQSFTMIYNLFGGRPSANVAYPAGTEEEPQAMNGTIRLSGGASAGTASGAAGVEKVYVQFDVTKGTDFSATDKAYIAGYTISGSENKIYTVHTAANVSVANNAEINWAGLGGDEDFWGIPVTGSNNWYKVINENLEFQNSYNEIRTGVYRVAVRSVALASDGVFGSWSPVQYFDIDTNIPVVNQEPARIVIEGSGTVDYVQDMFVKGNAKLQVAVADKADVTKVMVYTADTQGGLNDASQAVITTLDLTDSSVATREENTWTGLKGYTVKVALPLPEENKKDIYVKVVAYKANEASAYANYHINFDNNAPALKKLQFNSVDWLSSDESTHRLVNSNGKFTLGGTASDQESGYDKAAFYFIRGDVSDVSKYRARIYDPMANNKEILVKAKGATVLSLTEKTFGVTDAELGSSAQKMYGAEYENASISEVSVTAGGVTEKRSQITLASTVNENIKKSGYVLVDGNFYQIDTIDPSTKKITLTENISSIVGTHDVFFPFMQFVENTGSEKTDEDGLSFTSYPNSDDGDGMPESIIKSQSSWAWDASIQSANIPDGPGTIVVFVWDKAGNVSAASYPCSIQNNAPRLAKLYLGTDLDGSGTYDDEEFKVYDILGKTGLEQSSYVMNTEDYLRTQFKIKNGLALVTEFTGGNLVASDDYPDPTIRAIYNKASADNETKCLKSTAANQTDLISPDSSILDAGDLKSAVTAANSNMFAYSFAADEVGADSTYNSTTGEFSSKPMSWTFWDVTSDTTQGVNSSYMYLKVGDFIVDQNDTTPPEMKIKPFYWNSKEDSSVPTDDDENPLGHIDFAAVQIEQTKPGVSGRVYIEGTAHDNTRHGALFMVAPDGTEGQVAEFKEGKWIVGDNTTGTLRYKYMDGTTAVPTAAWTWDSNWKQFEILEAGKPNQEGHDVTWRFTIDMTPYGIGTDKVVTCYGTDAKDNTAAFNTTARDDSNALLNQTNDTTQTAKYIMDFVPYIKGIKNTNRSRLGRYPVRAGQTIQIEGMNFAVDSVYTVNYRKSDGTLASTIANTNVTKVSDGLISVTAPNYSAYLEVVVDGVVTQNNINQNTKWNIEEGNWKKGDVNQGSNYWTDDRYLSVWNVETSFAGSINPHSGVIKKVKSSNTPANGQLNTREGGDGVEFTTGNEETYFAALSSDDLRVYTYETADKTDDSVSKRTTFGTNTTDIFRVPADALDCTIINGVPYYVIQDNWVGNVDANCWGPGLFLARAGWQWDKNGMNSDGTPASPTSYHVIIEKQGNSGSARQRDQQNDGHDYVLYQFKNPRIAGWHKDAAEVTYDSNRSTYAPATHYLYVSYYDSYTRCLKYAAYKAGYRTHNNGKLDSVGAMWGSDTGRSSGSGDLEIQIRMEDNLKSGKAVVAGYDTLNINPSNFKEEAGEWSDIMVDVTTENDPRPVIIYYNKTKGNLEVAYGKTAFPTHDGNVVARGDDYDSVTDNSETAWTKTKGITPDASIDFGRYVSAVMDKDGNLHVAAQDATNAKLYYMFLKKNAGGTYTVDTTKTTVVDSSNGAGRWTDIELTDETGNTPKDCRPVISYLDTSYLGTTNGTKVAYADGFDTNDKPIFEAMTDPSKWQSGDQRTSVLSAVKENKTDSGKANVAVGFNSDMLALDFLRGEQ